RSGGSPVPPRALRREPRCVADSLVRAPLILRCAQDGLQASLRMDCKLRSGLPFRPMPGLPVSAIIHTLNEIENIDDCLRSVHWADEIYLVDSFSTDGT